MLGTNACTSSVYHGRENARRPGKISVTTQCHPSWTARWKLIRFLCRFCSDFEVGDFFFSLPMADSPFLQEATMGLY